MTMPPSSAPAAPVARHTGVPASTRTAASPPAGERPPDLPGCKPIPLPASEAADRTEAVLAVPRARGIDTAVLAEDRGLLHGHSLDASMAAALACAGEVDFRRRLRGEASPKRLR